MPSILSSLTTPIRWCSTPLNRRTEIAVKFSGRPEWNAGGWSELSGIFSGSPELLPATSNMLAGCTVVVAEALGRAAGKPPGSIEAFGHVSGKPAGAAGVLVRVFGEPGGVSEDFGRIFGKLG